MKGAIVILIALIVIGIIIYFVDRVYYQKKKRLGSADEGQETDVVQSDDECCGQHIVCEKNRLSPTIGEVPIYYDDEELDRYVGRDAISYSDAEVEEFREVLVTLLPQDVAGWSRSLQLRGIALPEALRDELLMIVKEEREK